MSAALPPLAVLELDERNREAAISLRAALLALDDHEDHVAAGILVATAAELVDDDLETTPFRPAVEQATQRDVDEAIASADHEDHVAADDLAFGVTD